MKEATMRSALIALVLVTVAACTQSSASPSFRPHPNDQQAREFLAHIVNLAEAKDFSALCSHGSLNCDQNLKDLDAAATVPTTAPLVVGSRDVPDKDRYQGGRLLEVCGLDGAGKAYRSSLLFFGTDDQFTVIEPLYWTSMGYSEPQLAEATTSASRGPEWATCPSGS
jgi:hypothetical protein